MKPFNVQEAKEGELVFDNEGASVRVAFFDEKNNSYHIVHSTHSRGSWVKGSDLWMAEN
jgi:hypothetical protein